MGWFQNEWKKKKTINRCQHKMTQMLELFYKDFKEDIINVFQQAIWAGIKKNNKIESFSKRPSLRRERRYIKENQMEI